MRFGPRTIKTDDLAEVRRVQAELNNLSGILDDVETQRDGMVGLQNSVIDVREE